MVGGSALGAPCCALDWHLGSHGRFLDLGPYLPGLRASTTMCKWASRSVQNTFNVIRKLYHTSMYPHRLRLGLGRAILGSMA